MTLGRVSHDLGEDCISGTPIPVLPGLPEFPQEQASTGDLPLLWAFPLSGCVVWKWISTGKMKSSAGGSLALNWLLRGSRTLGGSSKIGGNFKAFGAWRKWKTKQNPTQQVFKTLQKTNDTRSYWIFGTRSSWVWCSFSTHGWEVKPTDLGAGYLTGLGPLCF